MGGERWRRGEEERGEERREIEERRREEEGRREERDGGEEMEERHEASWPHRLQSLPYFSPAFPFWAFLPKTSQFDIRQVATKKQLPV